MPSNKLEIPDTGATIQYLAKDDARAVDWIFVADALNFCFWSYSGVFKWTVDKHTGYYALEAALSRAIKVYNHVTSYAKGFPDQQAARRNRRSRGHTSG
jgi:hypothetical protein